jgi:hypothetical protein
MEDENKKKEEGIRRKTMWSLRSVRKCVEGYD